MASRGMTPWDVAFAAYVRGRAGHLDRSQFDVAVASGVPTSTFHRYWHGQKTVSIGTAEAILEALGTTYAEAWDDIRRLADEHESRLT